MEQLQNLQTFIQPSPSRQTMQPSFLAGASSPLPWTVDSHAESKRSSATSPALSQSIPPDVYKHIRALRSCETQDLRIGLSLARERKFEHLMALMDYPTTDILRWHSSLCLYDDHEQPPSQSQFRSPLTRPPSALRNSSASTWSFESDARSSFLSTSTANTQYSAGPNPSPIRKTPHSILPSRMSSGSESSMSNNASHPGQEALLPDLHRSFQIPTTTNPPPQSPPPDIELPHAPSTTFFCTCCAERYRKKEDWEVHESLHQRTAEWHCDACNRVLSSYRLFRDHHKKQHGCASCRLHADDAMHVIKTKLTWGCGFCVKSLNDLKERNKHIAKHFSKENKVMSSWNYSTVVRSLLQEPTVATAWTSIIEEPASQTGFSWNEHESAELVTALEYKHYDGDFQLLALLLRELYDLGRPQPGVINKSRDIQKNTSLTKRPQALPLSSRRLIPGLFTSQTQQAIVMAQQQQNRVHPPLQNTAHCVLRPDSEVIGVHQQPVLQTLGESLNPTPLQSTARTSASDSCSGISHGHCGTAVVNYSRLRQRSDPLRKATLDAMLSIQGDSKTFHSTVNPQDLHIWTPPSGPPSESHPRQSWPMDETMSDSQTHPNLDTPVIDQDVNIMQQWSNDLNPCLDFSNLIKSNCSSNLGQASPTYDSRQTSVMDVTSSGFPNPSFS